MCRTYAKYGMMMGLLAAAGFVTGAVLIMIGFIQLWWDFPGTWEPMTGLTGTPQTILALQVPEDTFLIRTVDGQLFTCQEKDCTLAESDWSTEATRCTASNSPALASFFPTVLSWDIRVSLACERGYLDIAHALFLVHNSRGESYLTINPSLFPTDPGIIIIGLLGGIAGLLVGLFVGAVIITIVLITRKRQPQPTVSIPSQAN